MKTDYVAQCRFFTAEDACRIALQAYYAADRHITPPPGEPWMDEAGSPWASATDFAEAFSGELQARIGLLALDHLGEFCPMSMHWDHYALASLIEPEKMQPVIAALEAEWVNVKADFLEDEKNRLPPPDNPVNNQSPQGVGNAG